MKIVESAITVLVTTNNNYLVVGCQDGTVRFFDFSLRLESWFEDLGIHFICYICSKIIILYLAAGPITSVSFSNEFYFNKQTEFGPGLKFWCNDFIVGTSHAFIIG